MWIIDLFTTFPSIDKTILAHLQIGILRKPFLVLHLGEGLSRQRVDIFVSSRALDLKIGELIDHRKTPA